MKKIILSLFLVLILVSSNISAHSDNEVITCPNINEIGNVAFKEANPHDVGLLWDAESDDFISNGRKWNVVVMNFLMFKNASREQAITKAQSILTRSGEEMEAQPEAQPRGDLPGSMMCVYLRKGSSSDGLAIVAFEYGKQK